MNIFTHNVERSFVVYINGSRQTTPYRRFGDAEKFVENSPKGNDYEIRIITAKIERIEVNSETCLEIRDTKDNYSYKKYGEVIKRYDFMYGRDPNLK